MNNKERKAAYDKLYYQNNKDKYRKRQRKYYWTDKAKIYQAKVRISAIRQKIFDKLGASCKRCGFTDVRALQIDHIAGGGKKEIASFTKNLRTYYKKVLADTEGKYYVLTAIG